jgi:hypothetical protein
MENFLGYAIEFSTLDFNQPWMKITNNSTSESIAGFELTIGDESYNFDAVAAISNKSLGINEILIEPDFNFEGGHRSDQVTYQFSGFEPGKFFQAVDIDFDLDNTDSSEDYRQILFDLNGSDSSDNSEIKVTFSDGRILEGKLPDFAQNSDNIYTFYQILNTSSLTVDTLVDEDDGDFSPGDFSLREAIRIADSGAVIDFADGLAGTINLDAALGNLSAPNKSINIDGPGADVITVNGQGDPLTFEIGEGSIEGLTVVGGVYGTFRYSSDLDLAIQNSTITGSTGNGVEGEQISILNSQITNHQGSGVVVPYLFEGGIFIQDSVISSNARNGVDFTSYINGEVDIQNSIISNNQEGGLVTDTARGGPRITVEKTDIINNGLGIFTFSANSLDISESLISGNDGPGINASEGTKTISSDQQ